MDFGSLAQMGQGLLQNAGGDKGGDKAAQAISSMIPKEVLDKLPPAVKTVVTSQAVDAVAKQAPELLEVLSKGGKLTGTDTEKLKSIVMNAVSKAK